MLEELKGIDVNIDEIQHIIDKYHSGQNIIVVTGEFSSGKSSFINCYLKKKDFLPYGKTECTPILIDIFEGAEESIQVRKIDGSIKNVEYTNEQIYEYAKYDGEKPNDILSIDIPVINSGLPKGTHLVDTPGTNTVLKEHEKITNYIIKRADAVLYVFNKVISKSDINHINDILMNTKNIVFILSHVDEIDNKTNMVYSDEGIERLMLEAKSGISSNCGIETEDIIMYPVGSVEGYENRRRFDSVKEVIENFVKIQTDEKKKKSAQKKIESVLKTAIDNYSIRKEMFQKNGAIENEELQNKIEKSRHELDVCEREHDNRVKELEYSMDTQENICCEELKRMLSEEKESLSNDYFSLNLTVDEMTKKADVINKNISAKLRKMIEDSTNCVAEKVYDEANKSLNKIVTEFDLSSPFTISAPKIDELDDSRLVAKLDAVEKEIEENIKELNELKDNSNDDSRIELEKKIREYEAKKDEVNGQLIQLGGYKPEYITIEKEGGENAGRKTGRIIGEIADLALLIWNPAGGAKEVAKGAAEAGKAANEAKNLLKAADKVKDSTTILRYIKDAAAKAGDAGKKIEKERRKAIDKLQKENNGEDDTISQMLDMLSIGHWTEKLGGVIGNAVKPVEIEHIEDEKVKNEYDQKRSKLLSEINILSGEVDKLNIEKDSIIDDFGKQMRIKNELEIKNNDLKIKKQELECNINIQRNTNIQQQTQKYIENELSNYEALQRENGEKLIRAIFNEIKMTLVDYLTTDYGEKIGSIQKLIKELSETVTDSAKSVEECDDCISILSERIPHVEEWL